MKKGTKNVLRIVISIVYIIWGIWSPLSAIGAILTLNPAALVSAAVGVVTLLAGILGIANVKKSVCKTFGVIIFVLSIIAVVMALPSISVNSIINAILAWLFIICL